MNFSKIPSQATLAIGFGANIPSKAGPPITTLVAIRPKIEKIIYEWFLNFSNVNNRNSLDENNIIFNWSPLYKTNPVGGPQNQPDYINAVLLVTGKAFSLVKPSEKLALNLLNRCLKLEKDFGRIRENKIIKWGPRGIDIDLLAWGELQINHKDLILPHPRLFERSFAVVPLGVVLSTKSKEPRRIPPNKNWPE